MGDRERGGAGPCHNALTLRALEEDSPLHSDAEVCSHPHMHIYMLPTLDCMHSKNHANISCFIKFL